MPISIPLVFMLGPAWRGGKPLQSRADQNTRKSESGGQPKKNRFISWAESRVKAVSQAGATQTHQIIWHQAGPGCPAAIRQ
jgi:hypothetical protein